MSEDGASIFDCAETTEDFDIHSPLAYASAQIDVNARMSRPVVRACIADRYEEFDFNKGFLVVKVEAPA